MLHKTFGTKKTGVFYQERAGAYGICFDAEGKAPVAMTHLPDKSEGYFLLGGGMEAGETHAQCLQRECMEEAGLRVVPGALICQADSYHLARWVQKEFHTTGFFYWMDVQGVVAAPTEPDHTLVWLTLEQLRDKLFLPHQLWAVEQAATLWFRHRDTGA